MTAGSLDRRLRKIKATRSTGAPDRVFSDRPLADGEAAEAIAKWREWVADGRAKVSGNVP